MMTKEFPSRASDLVPVYGINRCYSTLHDININMIYDILYTAYTRDYIRMYIYICTVTISSIVAYT